MGDQVLAGEVSVLSVELGIELDLAAVVPLLVLKVFQSKLQMVPTSVFDIQSGTRNDGNTHVTELTDGILLAKLVVTGDPSSPPYAPYKDSKSVPVLLVLDRCVTGFGSSARPAQTSL